MYRYGIMRREAALTLLRLASEHHQGEGGQLPPEIMAKKKEIEAAIRNAELFLVRLRVVDQSMVDDVVRMKVELDGLYAAWATRETPTLH